MGIYGYVGVCMDRLVVTAVMFKLHSEMRKVKDKKVKDKKSPISYAEVANLLNHEEEEEIFLISQNCAPTLGNRGTEKL